MKPSLTPKQQKILEFIEEYYLKNGISPSLKEISSHYKKSIPTIHQYVRSLTAKGYLKKDPLNARNITPVQNINGRSGRKFRIGIIGYGIVGQAVEYGFSNSELHIYDKYKDLESLSEVVKRSDYIFICLPTPIKSDESGIDLSIINGSIDEITKYTDGTDKIIVIKSTVIPGTTEGFIKKYPKSQFAFNPEFLREASFLQDFINTDRVVVGAKNDQILRRVSSLYQSIIPSVPVYLTDPTTAEMVKYMSNCLLATRVIFANEMYDICSKLDIKYEEVQKMVAADKRIGNSHLDITTVRGFGGKCFPKDLLALRALAKSMKVDTSVLDTVWSKNLKLRKIKDWEEIPFAVSPSFGNTG